MKSLDQAFIKAYRNRGMGQAPVEKPAPTVALSSAAPSSPPPDVVLHAAPQSAVTDAAGVDATSPTAVMPKVEIPTVEALSLAVATLTTIAGVTTPCEPAWAIAPATFGGIFVADTNSPQSPVPESPMPAAVSVPSDDSHTLLEAPADSAIEPASPPAAGEAEADSSWDGSEAVFESLEALRLSLASLAEEGTAETAAEPAASPLAPPASAARLPVFTEREDTPAAGELPPAFESPAFESPVDHEPLRRAAFQVSHFTWPGICQRLETLSGPEFDHLFETVRPAVDSSPRIVGFGSTHRGQGATTVFLAVARRMAAQRCPALLVDADWSAAQVAHRLGLLPEIGWEAALAGRVSVEETLVESVDDGLGLLPLGRPVADHAALCESLGQQLAALRGQYPVVLVNLGALPASGGRPWGCAATSAALFDLVILVRDGRQADVQGAEVVAGLASAGFREVAVAENFVGPPPAL